MQKQNMKDVFFSESLYDEEQFFPLSDVSAPTDEEIMACPSSSTRIIYEDQDIATDINSSKVKFHEFMKVVLIPTKDEYKRARCDLWWKRGDFLSFQKSAGQELRFLSLTQNINIQEAKRQLYQPRNDEDEEELEYSLLTSMQEDCPDDPFYEFQNQGILRTRSESDELEEKMNQQVELPPREGEVKEPEHHNLTLCVPVEDPVPASNNMRVSKYRATFMNASTFAIMGVVSFAAPLIGFYLLSSH
jgi:hypothetical protein